MVRNCFFVFIAVSLFSYCSFAKDVDEQRILGIENKIGQIEKTYLENNKDMANAINKAEGLVQQSAELQGKIETNQHFLESQRKEFLDLLRELEFRIATVEQRLQIFSQQLSKALIKVAPEVAKEGDHYQRALDKVTNGHYLEAIAIFNQFLKSYPKSDFSADAMYWIGECQFVMKDHKQAIKSFQTFIDKYPKNKEVPSAIFKQGSSFYELGFEDDAKVFYKKVMTDHPQSEWAEKAKLRIEQIDLKAKNIENETVQPMSSYPTKTIIEQKDSSLKEIDIKTKSYPSPSSSEAVKTQALPADAKPISSVSTHSEQPKEKPETKKIPKEGF